MNASALVLHAPATDALPRRKVALATIVVAALLLVGVMVAGHLVAGAAAQPDFAHKNLPMSLEHPFGTDWLGRDMFLRTLAGLSTSLGIGLLAAGVSAAIALVLGCACALGPKKLDVAVTWLIDLMMGIPHIVLLILISYALGKGAFGVTVGVALTHWPSLTRVIRAEVLSVREAPYVGLARRLGNGAFSLVRRHFLPAVLPQFLIGAVLLFPHAILHEAAVSFLGFGIPPEQAAVGVILSESMSYLSAGCWWLAVCPGAALLACVALFDALGQNLRILADPRRAVR